MYVTYIPILWH